MNQRLTEMEESREIMGEFKNMESKIRALVVDDSNINRTIHHKLLKKLGIENQVVGNGKEAVDVHSSGNYFDLILMDMDMPIMNGIQVILHSYSFFTFSLMAGHVHFPQKISRIVFTNCNNKFDQIMFNFAMTISCYLYHICKSIFCYHKKITPQ